MDLPLIFTAAAWLVVFGGGSVWLWRTNKWTPRRHLTFLICTLPIQFAGLLFAFWGSRDAMIFATIFVAMGWGAVIAETWILIRRRENVAQAPDLRWNMKS